MHKLGLTTLAATAIAVATLGLAAPANAAPAPGSVQDTIDALQAQGYHVVLNKTGAAPLSSCTVTAIRSGQQFTPFTTRDENGVVPHTFSTVYVDIGC